MKQTTGRIICLWFAFIFLAYPVRSQVCSDTIRTLKYTSPSFQNSQYQSFPLSVSVSGSGHISFINKRTQPSPAIIEDSLLIYQTTLSGNVVWSRIFRQTTPSYSCDFNGIIVLSNGNILLSGNVGYTDNQVHAAAACLLLLDATGNLLWEKKYDNLMISACSEGQNGEILLAGAAFNGAQSHYTRLDGNGNLIDSYNYSSVGKLIQSTPGGIILFNNRVYIGGVFNDYSILSGYTASMLLMELDYSTGQVVRTSAYHLHNAAAACDSLSFAVGNTFTIRPGNQFMLTGGLYGNICPYDGNVTVRLDTNFNITSGIYNFVPAFISNGQLQNEYRAVNKGDGSYIYGINTSLNGGDSYYALIDSNNNFVSQRKIAGNDPLALPVLSFPGFDIQSGSSGLLQNGGYFQLINGAGDFISGSGCLGEDMPFLNRNLLSATPVTTNWTAASNNGVVISAFTPASMNFRIDTMQTCLQISVCDSLRIHGQTGHCAGDPDATFTLFKNTGCYKMNQWEIDTSAIAISGQPDDTTIRLHFSKPWKGYLYADIAGCGLKDSLLIEVQSPGQALSIGPDTTICPGGSLTLRASDLYASYRWQDGSTDSIYIARDTGLYYLLATDFCGIAQSDSVTLRRARLVLPVGNQKEICNKDSLIVALPSQLAHYTWAPEENAKEDNGSLVFFPDRTTTFTINAEKAPGCVVTDTLRIIVDDCRNLLYFPNAFTPNGDGRNEIFKPHADGDLIQYELSVYNRWGDLIFSSQDISRGWDGLFNGHLQPPGTFVWTCRYRFRGDRVRTEKGVLLLLR
ncbi:MAG TPA: gliding motility-associated C-terminal domain-containing protein [Puia sp.]|nr:gliding motility-associated C-terminal domain-containing protein [Puia sp.]